MSGQPGEASSGPNVAAVTRWPRSDAGTRASRGRASARAAAAWSAGSFSSSDSTASNAGAGPASRAQIAQRGRSPALPARSLLGGPVFGNPLRVPAACYPCRDKPAPTSPCQLARPITLTRGPCSHLATLIYATTLIRDMERGPN